VLLQLEEMNAPLSYCHISASAASVLAVNGGHSDGTPTASAGDPANAGKPPSSRRAVIAALVGNLLVTLTKAAAAAWTGT
jgi:hypothetical protein